MSGKIIDFPRKRRPLGLLVLAAGYTGTLRRGLDVEDNRADAATFAWQIAVTPARSYPEMMHKVACARDTAERYLGVFHPVTCFLNSVRDDCAALEHPLSREVYIPDMDLLTDAGAGDTDG